MTSRPLQAGHLTLEANGREVRVGDGNPIQLSDQESRLLKLLMLNGGQIVPIEPPRRHALYTSWLAAGHAGEMAYLARPDHVETRADLRFVLDAARSPVVVALAYDRHDPVPPAAVY